MLVLPPLTHSPAPTLFPYTTLFRSPSESRTPGAGARPPPRHGQPGRGVGDRGAAGRAGRLAMAASRATTRRRCRPAAEDRKSTRLNSSHVEISYAVFCLKKKNVEAH